MFSINSIKWIGVLGFWGFQSHGSSDPLLPHAAAQKLHQILSDAGLAGEWHGFQGGHEIPQNVLLQLNAFLERVAG